MAKSEFNIKGVSLISFSHLTHDLYPAFLPVLIPFLIKNNGISYGLSGLMIFLLRAPSLLNIFIGMAAEKVSTRYFIIIAPAITAILMSFVPLIDSFVTICIVLFFVGISSAAYHVPAPVMIKHISGKNPGLGMSLFMTFGEGARFLGPLMFYFTIDQLGYNNSYLMMIFGLLSSILVYFNFKDISIKNEFTQIESPFKAVKETWQGMRNIFISISGIMLGRALISAAMVSFLPTFMTNRGATIFYSSAALSILQFAGAAGALSSGTLSDFLGRKYLLHIITILLPIFMIIFLLSSGWFLIPMLLLVGFLLFAMTPINLTLVQDHGKKHPSTANSIYMTLNFVISSGIALIFGFISDIIGLENSYKLVTLLSFISIFFVFMLPKDRK